jgi:hypothetical protein
MLQLYVGLEQGHSSGLLLSMEPEGEPAEHVAQPVREGQTSLRGLLDASSEVASLMNRDE